VLAARSATARHLNVSRQQPRCSFAFFRAHVSIFTACHDISGVWRRILSRRAATLPALSLAAGKRGIRASATGASTARINIVAALSGVAVPWRRAAARKSVAKQHQRRIDNDNAALT